MAGKCGQTFRVNFPAGGLVAGSNCVVVSGSGTVEDPFVVDVVVDPDPDNGLSCGVDGLTVNTNLISSQAVPFPFSLPAPHVEDVWVDWTTFNIVLPEAGTYLLDVDVHAALNGDPPLDATSRFRIFDQTAGVVVPNSTTRACGLKSPDNPGTSEDFASTETSHCSVIYSVAGPSTLQIQVEARDQYQPGLTAAFVVFNSDDNVTGFSRIRYVKIAG